MKKNILLILLICSYLIGRADSDTTATRISAIKDDTLQAMAWYRAGFKYVFSDTSKASKYAKKCLEVSQKSNFTNGMIAYYHLMGEFADKTGDYDLAIEYFNKSLDICLSIGDKKSAGKRYNNLAGEYESKGDFKKSADYYLKCIKIFESINEKQGMAYAYIGLSNIFSEQNNDDKALEYITKGLNLSEEIKDQKGIASALNNQSIIFGHRKEYQKQLENLFKSLTIKEHLGDKSGMARNYDLIAQVYGTMGNNKKAHELFDKSLQIYKDLGDKENIAIEYTNIGEEFYLEGNYAKAKENYIKGLNLGNEIKYMLLVQSNYKALSKIFEKYKDYKSAYLYHLKYSTIKDSVLNGESSKQVAEMEAKYETEKKVLEIKNLKNEKALQQLEIEKQEAEVKRQNIQKLAFAGGFVLMLLFAFVAYRGYANKKKANIIITEQKHKVELQKEIIEEKHKEITDSINYAKRIQTALLRGEEEWNLIGKEHFILFKPKDVVSGDFYWCSHSEEKAFWVIADCTGHGVPGAFMSMLGISFLNEVIDNYGIFAANEILNKLREKVIKSLEQKGMSTQQKDGMDIALCVLDKKTKMLEFAGANNSIYIIRNKKITELHPDKMPIGSYTEVLKPFTSQQIQLNENDLVILFSDGYADQFGGEKGKKFRYKQFEELLINSSDKSLFEIRNIMDTEFEKWKGKHEQVDDVCVVGIKI